jgi:NitT/TauT family transport system ATP-binding protein
VALIEVNSVGKAYAARKGAAGYAALHDITFKIEESEFFCVIGPTGCGKSTLLHLVAGLDNPTSGEILFRGELVVGPSADRGVVFQNERALLPWLTVSQNAAFGPSVRDRRSAQSDETVQKVNEVLRLVGLTAHQSKYPRELSGGMKQRLQLARVLVNDPSVLFMDEPFGALDFQTRIKMQVEIARLSDQMAKTTFFITHDVGEAVLLGDRILVMTGGPKAGIRINIKNPLPRPRSVRMQGFSQLVNRLTEELMGALDFGTKLGAEQQAP